MFTRFEDHAAAQMLGQPDVPPFSQGKVLFTQDWQRKVYGLALAVSKEGYFEWEDFRQNLITAIAQWEQGGCPGQPQWDYYERFLDALLNVLQSSETLTADELNRCLENAGTGPAATAGSAA
ncbi:nitrile hydratase accessory protein [Polaromonas sp. YR568]|uniref:nitrile hydratase accessory protein n=1 Tax=Polaromonas sp. YR568 TaxID=1855301 RepID=UPI0008F36A36|nr:nitrile hydratase accessory protein [Polaromonas sp. YR568]SFU61819.1 nitrile hydratase accessory protein [Polaromonas sp. YR568]